MTHDQDILELLAVEWHLNRRSLEPCLTTIDTN